MEELESNGFILDDDKLVFEMGIRSPDYRSLAKDQVNYIKILEEKLRKKKLEEE